MERAKPKKDDIPADRWIRVLDWETSNIPRAKLIARSADFTRRTEQIRKEKTVDKTALRIDAPRHSLRSEGCPDADPATR
ncbi:hypothetical protein [Roseivivax sediminis]|uniref:hypothetical protein n=1 Tax=Roseivivax sediminis TaxID=936889 RepID=UPI00122D4749|nr:hypothetical protein [Roseivivax sediminis]